MTIILTTMKNLSMVKWDKLLTVCICCFVFLSVSEKNGLLETGLWVVMTILAFYLSLFSFTVLKCQSLLSEQRKLAIQFHLECTYISLTYYDYQPAKEHIQRAQELSGLNINTSGM